MSIQISVTVWTILCFLALMLILDRLLFRPLLSFMDKRREKIDGAKRARETALRQQEEELLRRELADAVRRFVHALGQTERNVFLLRYWYVCPVAEIAGRLGFSESKVKSMLLRTRRKLRAFLEKEAIV